MPKFKRGRQYIMDKGTVCEQQCTLVKPPFKNQFGEWFVIVEYESEAMDAREEYVPVIVQVRVPKERVSV
jgi:hypothetical protein